MSYSDAYITVLCDGKDGECSQELEVEAPFPYTHGTSMDRTDRDVEAKGWEVDGDQHFCEGCRRRTTREDGADLCAECSP